MKEIADLGFLNDQNDVRFADRKFGRFGNVGKNGCGMLALDNIERAADETTRFDPFYEARKPIKTNFFGLLGTRPSTIPKNLKRKGYEVTRIKVKKADQAEAFDGVIVLYWYFFGAHYVAGIGDGKGAYMMYNQFSTPRAMNLPDFLAHLKKQKLHIFRVWGIRFPKKEQANKIE
jgi:hypothetical protein